MSVHCFRRISCSHTGDMSQAVYVSVLFQTDLCSHTGEMSQAVYVGVLFQTDLSRHTGDMHLNVRCQCTVSGGSLPSYM